MQTNKSESAGALGFLLFAIFIAVPIGLVYFYLIVGAGYVAHKIAPMAPSDYVTGLFMAMYYLPAFATIAYLSYHLGKEHD